MSQEKGTSEQLKRRAAEAAMAEVRHGFRIGLGTGSTARYFVDLLGQEVAKGLSCTCVSTSIATTAQARSLGIRLTSMDETPELDLTVDGADELTSALQLIKGGGGALLQEKIVAAASRRMVVIADESKKVSTLGRFPLPIEVNSFGLEATIRAVQHVAAKYGATGGVLLRRTTAGDPVTTDCGHLILDASFGRILDAETLSIDLHNVPGVVEHGLFLGLCDAAYVASPAGVDVLTA